nr:molecular chaperone GroEL [Caproiciproducens sp.]
MSYIGPAIKNKFDSLSDDLKKEILKRDVKIYSIQDLIKCLDSIVAEG